MNLEGTVPAHKPRSQPAYPHSISRPLVPTFTLCTPSPDNLLHPECFQGWDPGVLILHRHQLHSPSPVGRGGHAEVTKPPTLRLRSCFLFCHGPGPRLSPLIKLTWFLKPESSALKSHPMSPPDSLPRHNEHPKHSPKLHPPKAYQTTHICSLRPFTENIL